MAVAVARAPPRPNITLIFEDTKNSEGADQATPEYVAPSEAPLQEVRLLHQQMMKANPRLLA